MRLQIKYPTDLAHDEWQHHYDVGLKQLEQFVADWEGVEIVTFGAWEKPRFRDLRQKAIEIIGGK